MCAPTWCIELIGVVSDLNLQKWKPAVHQSNFYHLGIILWLLNTDDNAKLLLLLIIIIASSLHLLLLIQLQTATYNEPVTVSIFGNGSTFINDLGNSFIPHINILLYDICPWMKTKQRWPRNPIQSPKPTKPNPEDYRDGSLTTKNIKLGMKLPWIPCIYACWYWRLFSTCVTLSVVHLFDSYNIKMHSWPYVCSKH